MEPSIIFSFLNSIFLQIPGLNSGPLGSENPLVKGMIGSAFGIVGVAIALNLFNAIIKRKMVDQNKLKRLKKRGWQPLGQKIKKKLMSSTKNRRT
jgi:uncharacterized membrane protein (DUF106 family)